jgi:predicted O-linked N-acetylglucosamine transferase (SPINDLY family)
MVTSKGREIRERRFLRADCGLPEDAFVFCSLNAGFKIEPVMFGRWMEILRQVPDGVLWLYGSSDLLRGNLQREAETRGIARDRLIFADEVAYEDYAARLALADLALDTRIYAGGATTCEALWAGVPVVALRGANFPSRMGASILPAAGLPELVTDDLEAYAILAVRLARDRGELAALRGRLRAGRTAAPLFDTARFARGLDRLYLRMWEIFAAGRDAAADRGAGRRLMPGREASPRLPLLPLRLTLGGGRGYRSQEPAEGHLHAGCDEPGPRRLPRYGAAH